MLALRTLQRGAPRWLATRAASTTPVALVGCGMPGRGMGWYHAKQILDGDVPSATLTDIVEPWFLGGGADGPGGAEFAAFKKEHEGKVRFHASIADMPKPDGNMMAMVCTRTADMPGYVDELVDHGVSHVFLEKPGAPTVEELGRMKDDCAAKGATIWMGFNKNVTAYVTKGREALAKVPGGDFTLVHHNAYKANELGECFERNAEGMLKNMAIHELALLVTFFGVNSDTLSDVVADKAYSDLRTEKGPSSGNDFTDFSRIGFTVTTKAGAKVSVYADRCGLELPDGAMADGGMMYSSVSKLGAISASRTVPSFDATRVHLTMKWVVPLSNLRLRAGIIQSRDIMPDADLVATVEARSKENPDWMPYFHLQHDDYITLKERCTAHIASGKAGDPEGIATIQIGYDTLKLAETLKPLLEKQLL